MWDVVYERLVNTVLMLVHPGQRFFWPFLLANVMLAIVICYWRLPKGTSERANRALEAVFPKQVLLHPSALLDYRYAAINAVMTVLILSAAGIGTVVMTAMSRSAMDALFGISAEVRNAGVLISVLYTFLAIFLFDTANFLAHYLQHRIPALWEFHKVHHSAEVLTPVTVLRMHPIDDMITATTHLAAFGFANGVFLHFYGGAITKLTVLGTNVFFFLYFISAYHLRHSHVWVMFPRGVREILSSPALHLVHHSKAERHWDKNFAPVFTLWDRVFGTLYQPKAVEPIVFGIAEDDMRELTTVRQLYLTPFRKAVRLIRERFGTADTTGLAGK